MNPRALKASLSWPLAREGSSEHDTSRDDLVVVSGATVIEPTKLRNEYRAFFQSKTASPIKEAASWCATQLLLSDPDQDSLYYEHLSATYANDRLYETVAECYQMAMQNPNPSWKALEGLAACLWSLCEWAETCRTMQSALADSAFGEGIGTDDSVALHTTTAGYFDKLPNLEKSFRVYQDVHQLRPDDRNVLCGLLESYVYFDQE